MNLTKMEGRSGDQFQKSAPSLCTGNTVLSNLNVGFRVKVKVSQESLFCT